MTAAPIFYRGDRVRIWSWSVNFHGLRGVVTAVPKDRVEVHLDGDERPTLFFPGEVEMVDPLDGPRRASGLRRS